jgi:hypothetical protein
MHRVLITVWFRDGHAPVMNTIELRFDDLVDRSNAIENIKDRYERDGFCITLVEFTVF